MACRTHPTHDSVFGNTYCGVPNPLEPHKHPYPTRYHGRVPFQPQAFFPYRTNPAARGPFMGRAQPMQPWELSGVPSAGKIDVPVFAGMAAGAALGAYIAVPKQGRADATTVMVTAAAGAVVAGVLGVTLRVQQQTAGK
jgi:hypothetical protein